MAKTFYFKSNDGHFHVRKSQNRTYKFVIVRKFNGVEQALSWSGDAHNAAKAANDRGGYVREAQFLDPSDKATAKEIREATRVPKLTYHATLEGKPVKMGTVETGGQYTPDWASMEITEFDSGRVRKFVRWSNNDRSYNKYDREAPGGYVTVEKIGPPTTGTKNKFANAVEKVTEVAPVEKVTAPKWTGEYIERITELVRRRKELGAQDDDNQVKFLEREKERLKGHY